MDFRGWGSARLLGEGVRHFGEKSARPRERSHTPCRGRGMTVPEGRGSLTAELGMRPLRPFGFAQGLRLRDWVRGTVPSHVVGLGREG